MSDTGEPDATGGMFGANQFGRRALPPASTFPTQIQIPGLQEASDQIREMNEQLRALQTTLQQLSSTQASMATGLNQMFKGIQQNASQAAQAVGSVTSAMGGGGGGGFWSGGRAAGLSIASVLGGALNSNLMKDIAMFPLRFMQTTLNQSRQLAMTTNVALGGTQFATGMSTGEMMRFLAGIPGNVLGAPEDILNVMNIARQAGAMFNPARVAGGQGMVPGRGPGFLEAVRQAQVMMPGTPVGELASTIGGFAANVPGQQQAAYMTGGAFAMLAPGGGMKSISQWAEGILRWLEGQRPGNKRGQAFTYGELLSQYFPGSNIDAWLAVNGVPPNMRDYWWTYSLGKAVRNPSQIGTGGGPLDFTKAVDQSAIAYQRLQATTALTRTGFGLGGTMAGAFANKEISNRWFNEMIGQAILDLVPSRIASGPLQALQFLPDTVEELLMSLLERAPNMLGTLLGGMIGWGPGIGTLGNMFGTFMGSGSLLMSGMPGGVSFSEAELGQLGAELGIDLGGLAGALPGGGDVGDDGVAGWGSLGGRTTAGLHPDMRRKLNLMMRANPRLRITSGLRNTVQQRNLRQKGYTRVSGKPSAHTRGLAADLGPSSEYPWIVANAKRFGLRSGAGVGEPWHVGIGDDGVGLGGLFNLLMGGTAVDQTQTIETIGTLIPAVMNVLFGAFGGEPMKAAEFAPLLAFRPDLYTTLRGITPTAITGGTFGGGGGWSTTFGLGGGGGGPAGAASPEAIYAYLKQNGVSAASAAGILANIKQESNFDPFNATGDGGTSGGLFQHHAGRWAALKSYAASTNRAWTDWQAQVDYALIEARQMGINLQSSSPQAAAREWTIEFERPANAQQRAAERAAIADQYMFGDMPDPYSMMATGGSVRINNPTFNNTFIIQGGGSGGPQSGGIDVRRAVTQIADHLEGEMKQRMARQN